MKHPIAYRIAMYSVIALLCGSIIFILKLMDGAPFKSSDMRNAYYHGCNYGSRPLTDESIANCSRLADMFKETLDDLDRQMEAYEEKMLKDPKE